MISGDKYKSVYNKYLKENEMKRLIRYFKNYKLLLRNHNMFGYECPNCGPGLDMGDGIPITASSQSLWDEQYKQYKFFVKCKSCNFTTPAYPTLREAEDKWADAWSLVEDQILMNG